MQALATTSVSVWYYLDQQKKKFRLHIYDHCPYCVRVQLAFGLRDLKTEDVVYGYGDKLGDPSKTENVYEVCLSLCQSFAPSLDCLIRCVGFQGGVVLTGKKALPVFEITVGGVREGELNAESLDIIAWVQKQEGIEAYTAKSERKVNYKRLYPLLMRGIKTANDSTELSFNTFSRSDPRTSTRFSPVRANSK